MKRDPEHPSRLRPSFLVAYYYCQICEKERKYMKYLEEKYYQRSDEWGDEVLLRLAGVRNNFVAADGRTHKDCKTKFHLSTREDDETLKEIDHGFLKVAKEVSSGRKKIGLPPNHINYILMK